MTHKQGNAAEPQDFEFADCPQCGRINAAASAFCAECGARLSARRPAAPLPSGERVEIGHSIRVAMRRIKLIRYLILWPTVVFAAFNIVIFLVTFYRTALPIGFSVLVLGLFTALLLFGITALNLIWHQPFFWAVLVASLYTLDFVLTVSFALYSGEYVAAAIPRAVWMAVLWVAVLKIVPVERLVRDHPDHFTVLRLRNATARRGSQATPAELRARAVARTIRADAVILVLIATLTVTGAVVRNPDMTESQAMAALYDEPVAIAMMASDEWDESDPTPLDPLEPHLEAFVEAWNRSDVAAIDAMFAERQRMGGMRQLERALDELGWTSRHPASRGWEFPDSLDAPVTTRLLLQDGHVDVRWAGVDEAWVLTNVQPGGG